MWATPENAATLLKLLGDMPAARTEADARTTDRVAQAVVAIGPGVEDAVIPLLKSPDGLVRREACGILGDVGTNKSVQPLEAAGQGYLTIDVGFYRLTQLAVAKIVARQ